MSSPEVLLFNVTYPVVAPMFQYVINNQAQYVQAPKETHGNLAGTNWNLMFDGDLDHQPPGSLGIGNAVVVGGLSDMIQWSYTGQYCYVYRTTNMSEPQKLDLSMDGNHGYSMDNPAFTDTMQWSQPSGGPTPYGQHNVTYYMNPRTQMESDDFDTTTTVTVTNITLTHGLVIDAENMDQVAITTEYFVVDGALNTKNMSWTRLGGSDKPHLSDDPNDPWTVKTTLGPDNDSGQSPIDYIHASANGYDAYLKMDVPLNTTFLMVNGTLGPNYARWNVRLKPLYHKGPTTSPIANQDVDEHVSAANIFVVPNIPLFAYQIDPTLKYTLIFDSSGEDNVTYGGLSSITYYSSIPKYANKNTDSDSTQKSDGIVISKGAIAGIVVGVVVAICLIAAAAWWFVRHRDTRRRPTGDDFLVDTSAETRAVPFNSNHSHHRSGSVVLTNTRGPGSVMSDSTFGGKGADGGSQPFMRSAVHELDASEMIMDEEPEKLPPMYKESWAPAPSSSSRVSTIDCSSSASEVAPLATAQNMRDHQDGTGSEYDTLLTQSGHSSPLMSTPMLFGPSGAGKPPQPR